MKHIQMRYILLIIYKRFFIYMLLFSIINITCFNGIFIIILNFILYYINLVKETYGWI